MPKNTAKFNAAPHKPRQKRTGAEAPVRFLIWLFRSPTAELTAAKSPVISAGFRQARPIKRGNVVPAASHHCRLIRRLGSSLSEPFPTGVSRRSQIFYPSLSPLPVNGLIPILMKGLLSCKAGSLNPLRGISTGRAGYLYQQTAVPEEYWAFPPCRQRGNRLPKGFYSLVHLAAGRMAEGNFPSAVPI